MSFTETKSDEHCIPIDLITEGLDVSPHIFEPLRGISYNSSIVRTLAAKLGNSLDNYDNSRAAGRMLLYDATVLCRSTTEYLDVMGHRFNLRAFANFSKYTSIIDADIAAHIKEEYENHDMFSASCVVKNYLAAPTFGMEPWESVQHMFYRVAIQTYGEEEFARIRRCKDNMSRGLYTPASPTLFNASMRKAQMSSCFLFRIGDNLVSILKNGVFNAGMISASNGGLGITVSDLRHSQIADIGMSSGVVPAARVYDRLTKYVDQGGKRDGACTLFLKIGHIDIEDFIKATDNYTDHTQRLATANTCIWTTGAFFDKVRSGEPWYVFCPAKTKELKGLFGDEYAVKYEEMVVEALKREAELVSITEKLKVLKNKLLEDRGDAELRTEYVATMKAERDALKNRIEYKKFDKASDLMTLIVRNQIKASTPYIMHGDAVNWKNNQKHLGEIEGSNLCVSGDTYILTREGHQPIASLVGKEVEVWNGDAWSKVTPKQTSPGADLVYVVLSNGLWLACTPQHKFITANGEYHKAEKETYKSAQRVDAINLQPGTRLIKHSLPIVEGNKALDFAHPYTHGFWCGDGTIQENINYDTKIISLYGEKKNLFPFLAIRSMTGKEDSMGRLNTIISHEVVEDKFQIPHNTSIECRLQWLAGLFDADGTVARNGSNASLQLRSINQNFLYGIQLMLQTLGVFSHVAKVNGGGVCSLPNGNGGYSEYTCKPQWRIIIASSDTLKLLQLGMVTHRLRWDGMTVPKRDAKRFVTVVSIYDAKRHEPTYCFTEPLNNAGMFNGILTGQCLEIIEWTDTEQIASCNLGSHNLPVHVKRTLQTVDQIQEAYDFDTFGYACRELVEDLDTRIDSNHYPLDEYDEKGNLLSAGAISPLNKAMRPLGIGVSGLDDTIKMMDLVYESVEGQYVNKVLFACKYFNELLKTIELASQKGAYPWITKGSFKRYLGMKDGVRQFEVLTGSPFHHGILQFDLWQEEAQMLEDAGKLYKGYDRKDDIPIEPAVWGQKPYTFNTGDGQEYTIEPTWDSIRTALRTFGARNSMLGAIMPTASTANVFRNAESTEALQSNVFSREIQKGNYLITSRHLEKDLRQIGCWSFNLMKFIITCEGSVKHMIRYITDHPDEFPKAFHDGSLKADVLERLEYLVLKYKTMFEISQKSIILMSRHRGIYIDQSQSLNIHVSDPKEKVLEALHMYSYFMGLKTGMYYLRQSPAKFVGSFDVDPSIITYKKSIEDVKKVAGPVRFLVGGGEQPSLTDDERAALTHVGLPIASSSLVPTTISAPAVCKIGAKYSEGCMSCQ